MTIFVYIKSHHVNIRRNLKQFFFRFLTPLLRQISVTDCFLALSSKAMHTNVPYVPLFKEQRTLKNIWKIFLLDFHFTVAADYIKLRALHKTGIYGKALPELSSKLQKNHNRC